MSIEKNVQVVKEFLQPLAAAIEMRSLSASDDATMFRTLNEEWITTYLKLEAKEPGDPGRSSWVNSSEGRSYPHGLCRC